ncbi:hypothetical protein TNCV_1414901 [Trichonephila clavipes]|nr:hypothetical protein TNCV_1414901 [Trichonephila clavipes]
MSRVLVLTPLKACRVEEPIREKSVVAGSPHVGMVSGEKGVRDRCSGKHRIFCREREFMRVVIHYPAGKGYYAPLEERKMPYVAAHHSRNVRPS